jgi:hypothetical protein
MKKSFYYIFAVVAICVASCKGKTTSNGNDTSADSGQTHVSAPGPADSNNYQATPVETGGQDTSGNGSGNANTPKDTLKKKP